MPKHQALTQGLALVFQGIERLSTAFPNRRFTIDGRLVGDIGEVIAELEYDIKLHDVSQPDYDGITSDGRKVQIKARPSGICSDRPV
jgi:predicted ester cyclase